MTYSVAIHQPEHMPWGGFFYKMNKSDIFVILDSVQFTKNNWQNRNRFVSNRGDMFWLTVPVKLKGHIEKEFREIEIDEDKWKRKYLKTIRANYSKAPYFLEYWDDIEKIISSSYTKLIDLNMCLINYFRTVLGINNKLVFSSSLNVGGNRSALLLNICKKLNASIYISGIGGKSYLDLSIFDNEGVECIFSSFKPNVSHLNTFHEGASILDILFLNGANNTKKYVLD